MNEANLEKKVWPVLHKVKKQFSKRSRDYYREIGTILEAYEELEKIKIDSQKAEVKPQPKESEEFDFIAQAILDGQNQIHDLRDNKSTPEEIEKRMKESFEYHKKQAEKLKSLWQSEAREELMDEQRKDMSWANWEEGFAETWMDISPEHGQANAKCYIKKLVDKYVAQAREEERKRAAELLRISHRLCRCYDPNECILDDFKLLLNNNP